MHRTTPRRLALGLLLTGAGTAVAAPAGVQAATVTVNLPCQVATFGLTAQLSGFTPNSTISVTGDGIFESATADATGSAQVQFTAPNLGSIDPKSKQYNLVASDDAPTPIRASGKFRSTNFAFGTTGGTKSPKATRSWRFSGLTPGKTIYGHFRFGGRTRANYRFGVAKAPCGELTVLAPGIPVTGRVNTGKWNVQVDQKKVYSRTTKPRLTGSTTVFTTFG
ncbi:MAG: hypothetical protein JWM31_1039 [Solirubrobacterales bacterium]|nr:hypothetical protein [Solirubrobacterales bacterium]